MNQNLITFKIEEIRGQTYDCEDCGSYSGSGVNIYVNDNLVWHKYSDGHMSGEQTEDTILNCVTKEWYDINVQVIEQKYTEKARNVWNEKYPGNGIARTPESWAKEKDSRIKSQQNMLECVIESCQNLPYEEPLQVKMIALWIESATGVKVVVEETFFNGE